MNYMSQVAEMLGVELDEEFDIAKWEGTYRLTELGLIAGSSSLVHSNMLSDLLRGKKEIQKRPWRPKEGKFYWAYDALGRLCTHYYPYNSTIDQYNFTYGNCFRTSADARANKDKALEAFGLTEWLERN